MSYSWDFLFCINICETVESSSVLCVIGLFINCSDPSNVYQFTETCFPFVYHLSNLEFDSLICLGNWFNCLLLLMHIHSNIKAELRKLEGNLG